MIRVMKTILAALALTFLAGCATDPASTTNQAREEPVYSTGSNIAKKRTVDPAQSTLSKEDWERERDRAPPPMNPNSGGGRTR
jgi:type IV pilus biogenesis protein CpaD/CtpE